MSHSPAVQDLLVAALAQAADVAASRLDRAVSVRASEPPQSAALLRFDLGFDGRGTLSWFVSNEDATGFSDLLIGGAGDRGAVLTEMHLDALTVAFSDMLSRAVDAIASGLDEPLEAGGVDMGMESELPEPVAGGMRTVLALEVAGFGNVVVVQQLDATLTRFFDQHAVEVVGASTPVEAAAAPASAGPAGDAPVAGAAGPAPDNVVQLPGAAAAAASVTAAGAQGTGRDLDLLMNVPLPLTVELGRTQRTIRELVEMSVGSIIELGKLAGDPLDIMVNDRVIARGEVVVIDEEFGLRVTEIVSPDDRLRGLG